MKTECVQRKLGTRADDTVAKVSVTRLRFIRLPPNWWKPALLEDKGKKSL